MAISHMAILLLQTGKSTEGERVHSRLRYLALTFLNLAEVVLFGAIVILAIKNLSNVPLFATGFSSRTAILYHCFKLTMLNITVTPAPASIFGYLLHTFIALVGMELIVVVLAIVLTIKAEDEAFLYYEPSMEEYWSWRARLFDRSPWASDLALMKKVVDHLQERNVGTVLDVGCGPGLLAMELSAHGMKVTGVDISEEMLRVARKYSPDAIKYIPGSATALPSPDNAYDAVVMRMLLHNVIDWRKGLRDAYRVLREGQCLIIVEGFPPSEECRPFFQSVLSKVHKREYFTESVLMLAIEEVGFKVTSSEYLVVHQASVVAWLESSVPDPKLRKELLEQHNEMPAPCQKAYNLTKQNGDCLIDMQFCVIACEKT